MFSGGILNMCAICNYCEHKQGPLVSFHSYPHGRKPNTFTPHNYKIRMNMKFQSWSSKVTYDHAPSAKCSWHSLTLPLFVFVNHRKMNCHVHASPSCPNKEKPGEDMPIFISWGWTDISCPYSFACIFILFWKQSFINWLMGGTTLRYMFWRKL